MTAPVYRRVLLKLSGEALQGDRKFNIDPDVVRRLAGEVAEARAEGVAVALTVGGGNIFRGRSAAALGIERVPADYMGMLATVINSLALQEALEKAGAATRVLSAIEMRSICEPYIKRRATRHLEKGRIVIFAGGTGNPYFSTDTAAALRAVEIGADVILKATKVDGIYDRDPAEPGAHLIPAITYREILDRGLAAMDATATSLAMENRVPIVVFNLGVPGNIRRVLHGEPVGTRVSS